MASYSIRTQGTPLTAKYIAVFDADAEGAPFLTDVGNVTVVLLPGLPTADPHVKGQLWANSGVLTVSSG